MENVRKTVMSSLPFMRKGATDVPLQRKERPLPIDLHTKLQTFLYDTRPNFVLISNRLGKILSF